MTLSPPNVTRVPPLENGDHLTRAEFERRYTAMPKLKKAELIEGIVYVPSPVRVKKHGQPHSDVVTWPGVYRALTPNVMVCDNTTVRLDADNEPQPDALLRIEAGGQSGVSEDDYIEGPPELIIEIAASTASYDLHEKLRVYRRNGVREYLVWLTHSQTFCWYSLQDGEYVQQAADSEGILKSQVFPGLWLLADALLAGELSRVLDVLQRGLATQAHRQFVEEMGSPSHQ